MAQDLTRADVRVTDLKRAKGWILMGTTQSERENLARTWGRGTVVRPEAGEGRLVTATELQLPQRPKLAHATKAGTPVRRPLRRLPEHHILCDGQWRRACSIILAGARTSGNAAPGASHLRGSAQDPSRPGAVRPDRQTQRKPLLENAGAFWYHPNRQTRLPVPGLAPWQPPDRGEMTARTWRISPHTDHPHTRLDRLATLVNGRITRDRLRIPCPAHGGTNNNLELKVVGDRIAAACYSARAAPTADIAKAIEDQVRDLHRPRQPLRTQITPCRTERRPTPPRETQDLRPHALNASGTAHSPFPNSPDHPARLWLAARHLWRPELPVPSAVRWIGTSYLHKDFKGAGAVIAMAAAPAAWTEAWPNLPDLTSVQLVYVAEDGTPARDRGLTKRTYAPDHGTP